MGEGDRDPDEIVLFWQGQRLLALIIAGGCAGILQPSLAWVLPGLPIVAALRLLRALGASDLGAVHFLSRTRRL
jgi:hypothetical protein